MSRVRLIHWNGSEGRERKLRLASLGYHAEFDDLDGTALLRKVRGEPPDAVLIDLTRLPSHGREVALSLRSGKTTREVPIVFLDGDPEKVAKLKTVLPDATYTTWARLKTALPRAIARRPARPVVPPPSIYSSKPAAEKLGIKADMRVSLLGAPPGFAGALGSLPSGVKLSGKADAAADLFLCVVRSARELTSQLDALARSADRQTLWAIWPKKASGTKTDLDGNIVRESGLRSGWVDFKVCAIDETWSGLAFKRRK
jgi:hypothetical protein